MYFYFEPLNWYFQLYLSSILWIDISCLGLGDNASELLIENQKVAFNPGTEFGDQYGAYVRLNFATSPEIIEEGIKRLAS